MRFLIIFVGNTAPLNPTAFYTQQIEKGQADVAALKKRLRLLSLTRLLVFLASALAVYFLWSQWNSIAACVAVGVVLFVFLINRYTNTKRALHFSESLLQLNQRELRCLSGDFSDNPTGRAYIFEEHAYNQDIDLFGEGSLFQKLNRTALKNGERQLAAILNSNDATGIAEKQAAISELSETPEWRQNYTTIAALIKSDVSSETVSQWIHGHTAFVPQLFRWLPTVFSAASVGVFAAYFFGLINGYMVGAWLLVGLAITAKYVSRITQMYNATSKIDDLLSQYAQLLKEIESRKFNAELLQHLQKKVLTEGMPASQILSELSAHVNSLGNRNNMLFGVVGNGFLLWDLRYTYRIERWISSFDGALTTWFEAVETLDAMNSLGNFTFNHPEYINPVISSDTTVQFSAKNLGHPLLDPEKRVNNSISMSAHEFFIITGANMAGKSTFLRTVAMNLVMANCGLPVCADTFEYTPVKLISSMRTSDSLVNDESYFFSELKRLKFIVETLKKDTYFIILDEILKGTNSVDKAEGSKKFVQRLVASNSTGLIATHDLSLCTLADDYAQIKNHYFDAEIINDELHFDYRFKDGICQNMNASFLLKKMQIVE